MSVYKPYFRYALLAGIATIIVAGVWVLAGKNHPQTLYGPVAGAEAESAEFSPAESLEEADINLIDSATETIDVAMYAFTDTQIASALDQAAKRGVRVRIYRDSLQLAAEESRAALKDGTSVTDSLKTEPGVEVRVKAHGQSMHLKAYCVDKRLLRTGSANWSFDGETAQDNDLYVISNPSVVKKFEDEFDLIWRRSGNAVP